MSSHGWDQYFERPEVKAANGQVFRNMARKIAYRSIGFRLLGELARAQKEIDRLQRRCSRMKRAQS